MKMLLLPLLAFGLIHVHEASPDEMVPLKEALNPTDSTLPVPPTTPTLTSKEQIHLDDTKISDFMIQQIGSTKSYDKLEEAALMQTFPFLQKSEKKNIEDFKDLFHDPRLTKGELHEEREKWANFQPADVQVAYRKWEQEKRENKKKAIAHTEKNLGDVSPETKALYENIKTIVMNQNITRTQECELIRQVMEAAEHKVQDEFFAKINMNLVSYCLKKSQPQSVRSSSIDHTSPAPAILPTNPVHSPTANPALPSIENFIQNDSISFSDSKEPKSSQSDSASSEPIENIKGHRNHRRKQPYKPYMSGNGWTPLVFGYGAPNYVHPDYRDLLYGPLHPAYIPAAYLLSQPYGYLPKPKHKGHSHHSLKYLKKKLRKAKNKGDKRISISSSSSSSSEPESSESEEKHKKKQHKNHKQVKNASPEQEKNSEKYKKVKTGFSGERENQKEEKVKTVPSEEKELKSEEKMEKEQGTPLEKPKNGKDNLRNESSSNGSSASSSGASTSNENNVHIPKKHKDRPNKSIKFVRLESAPEWPVKRDKNDDNTEDINIEKKLNQEHEIDGGQQTKLKEADEKQIKNIEDDQKIEPNDLILQNIAEKDPTKTKREK